MGDTPVLMEEKLNYKQTLAHTFGELKAFPGRESFPIHSDWAYYRAQDYPQEIISSAISLDACTPESGPIHLWPGSHMSYLQHEAVDEVGGDRPYRHLRVKPGLIDPEAGVDVLAPAGSLFYFHALLVHSSRPNESGAPRRLMISSHYPARADMGFDARNGPIRLHESPWEWRYARARLRGEFEDVFRAPAREHRRNSWHTTS